MQMVPAISKVGRDASHGSHRAVAPTGGGRWPRANTRCAVSSELLPGPTIHTDAGCGAARFFASAATESRDPVDDANIVSMRRRRSARNCGAVYVP